MFYLSYLHMLLVLALILPQLCVALTFTQFKQEMQAKAMQISSKLEEYYKQWCPNGEATCQTKTINSCKGIEQSVCDLLFPKLAVCFTEGYKTANRSNIKFPSDINYDQLSQQQIRFICASAKLETVFHSIINERGKKITSMYIGSNRGLFRQFPGNYHGDNDDKCDDYDPRYRPWYTIAASGAKNVIILLDKSSSMADAGKIQVAKSAVLSVIDSFSISDNVAVIAFENSTEDIGSSQLMKMTSSNKQSLQQSVKNVVSHNGQTNFRRAFQRGLQMVKEGISSGVSGCSQAENVFLLITDGKPTQDAITAEALVELIKQKIQWYQIKRQIIVFAYALGQVINTQFLKVLTCSFRGIVIVESNIQVAEKSSSAFATKLREFYIYLSVGVKFTSPVWTQPYDDYYGYGSMVTVSMPAYYIDQKTNLSKMIGVTGVDVVMSQFDKFGFTEQEVVTQLIGQSACQKNEITDCQLQALRGSNYQCNSNCSLPENTLNTCDKIPKTAQIYKNTIVYKNNNRCCGLTVNEFIITMVFSIFGFFTFLFVLLCRKRIYKRFCDRSYKKIKGKGQNEGRHSQIKLVQAQQSGTQQKKGSQSSASSYSATHLRTLTS